MYGIIFPDNTDGAFSTYRLHESIGLVIGFVLINSPLCMDVKMYIFLGLFVLAVALYYWAEYVQNHYLPKDQRPSVVLDNNNEVCMVCVTRYNICITGPE